MRPAIFCLLLLSSGTTHAQLLSDPLEGTGDESYFGGFGAFNWVDAGGFGIANHAGAEAFLSNYTGQPLIGIGMIKPLNATIGDASYRVSFYYSRYSSIDPVPYNMYDALYIGSPDGTMEWDTVPTPMVDGEWLRWSGIFSPAPTDIGQPFRFGFTMTLNSGTSLAIDGPLEIVELSTAVDPIEGSPTRLEVLHFPGSADVSIRCPGATEVKVYDAQGRLVPVNPQRMEQGWRVDASPLPHGHYIVRCTTQDGAALIGRFVIG